MPLHKALLHEVVRCDDERLGDAILAGQATYADTGAFPALLSIYHLLGDPALKQPIASAVFSREPVKFPPS